MMGSGDGGMFFGGGFMWLFWIALIVIIAYAIKMVITGDADSQRDIKDRPIDILKRRFAQGEIDEDEFQRRRKEIER